MPTLGRIDYQLPIGALMTLLRRTEDSFRDPRAFMRPSDGARARWAKFDAGSGLKVGICWASNPALFHHDSARRGRRKSMPLDMFAPLADVPGVSFTSVLNWRAEPMPPAFKSRLRDVSVRLTSLEETAALIERLDIVITVDTAVAHLAGALAKRFGCCCTTSPIAAGSWKRTEAIGTRTCGSIGKPLRVTGRV